MHPAKDGYAALPFFDDFDLSEVDILLISQYVRPFLSLHTPFYGSQTGHGPWEYDDLYDFEDWTSCAIKPLVLPYVYQRIMQLSWFLEFPCLLYSRHQILPDYSHHRTIR